MDRRGWILVCAVAVAGAGFASSMAGCGSDDVAGATGDTDGGDESMSARGKIHAHVALEAIGPADERTIIFVSQKIVKNALPANALDRSNNVEVGIKKIDVRP